MFKFINSMRQIERFISTSSMKYIYRKDIQKLHNDGWEVTEDVMIGHDRTNYMADISLDFVKIHEIHGKSR